MRTLIIILAGFATWLVFLGIAKIVSQPGRPLMTPVTVAFVAVWFIVAAANMWIGISHAGYSFQEELPIFLLIFMLPTAAALFIKWKFPDGI